MDPLQDTAESVSQDSGTFGEVSERAKCFMAVWGVRRKVWKQSCRHQGQRRRRRRKRRCFMHQKRDSPVVHGLDHGEAVYPCAVHGGTQRNRYSDCIPWRMLQWSKGSARKKEKQRKIVMDCMNIVINSAIKIVWIKHHHPHFPLCCTTQGEREVVEQSWLKE